jgi:PAS domain S-box-containing protein
MRLTRRLIALSLVALAPAVAIQIYNEAVTRRTREAEVRDTAIRSAEQAAFELERIVEGVKGVLISISKVESVRALDTPRCVAYLSALQPDVPHLVSLAAIDLDGNLRCRQDALQTSATFADRPYFKEVLTTRQFVIGEFTEGRVRNRLVLPVAAPIWDDRRELVGVAVAAIDLAWLGERLRERGLPRDGSVTVADRNGIIVAREPFSDRFVGTRIPGPFLHLLKAPTSGALEVTSQDGTRRILGYVPLSRPPVGLYVSTGLSSEASFATIDRSTWQGLLVIGLGTLLALFGAWLVGRHFIQRPVRRLLDTAKAWRGGDLTARTGLTAQAGELGVIGEEFDRVAEALSRREGALRESESRFRELADSAPVLIWMSGPNKEGIYFNKPWLSFTGRSLDQELGAGWLESIHPKDCEALEVCAVAFEQRRPFQTEFRMRRHDGEWRWILDTGVPRFAPGGEFQGFVGSCLDITERKRDEQRQKLLVNELNHRVKNTLTTVQSLAAQTLRASASLERFGEAFEARLLALSKTHDILTSQSWEGASLRRVLTHEVAPYLTLGDRNRLILAGEDLQLPPKYALTMGLAFHELATNAVKYGALSVETGRVDVSWQVHERAEGTVLDIEWSEHGGPPVKEPSRRGFGSRLIERSIRTELQGSVDHEFAPDGLRIRVRIPIPAERPAWDVAGSGADKALGQDAA